MNSKSFALSLICSLSVAQAFAQFEGVSESKTTQEIINESGRPAYLNSIDLQAVLREVSLYDQTVVRTPPGSKASAPSEVRTFDIVMSSMDELSEHTVEEVALALKVAGYREDSALTFYMHQDIAKAQRDKTLNLTRKAMKIKLEKYIAAIREKLGFPVQTSVDASGEIAVDNKSYSISDRVLDTVRVDGNKVRIEFYSSSGINGNRDISMIKKVGEKAYLEIRSNRNYEKKLYYGAGADIGRKDDRGHQLSRVIFYFGGNFDGNFRLQK
jgi:hypothetical protein